MKILGRELSKAGMQKARERGVKFGRKRTVDYQAVLEARHQGLDCNELMTLFNAKESKIRMLLHRHGYSGDSVGPIKKMLASGWSLRSIARLKSIPEKDLKKLLRETSASTCIPLYGQPQFEDGKYIIPKPARERRRSG